MEKRKTIRDIAQELNVSTATVHRALYGKKGVSRKLQGQILNLCDSYGFQINGAASALKRGLVQIAAVLPSEEGPNRYYYESVWRGVNRCVEELQNYNIQLTKITYSTNSEKDQEAALLRFGRIFEELPDGLLTIGHFGEACGSILKEYSARGLPTFLTCDDAEDCGRLACVQANYAATGRMVAELLSSQLPKYSTVLLCAGDETIPSHYRIVRGFEEYIKENRVLLHVRKLYGYYDEADLQERLDDLLRTDASITGAFSVSARLSVLLMNTVRSMGLKGKIRLVASDLFRDTRQALEDGLIQEIVFKDPEQQAYLAAKMMTDYILRSVRPDNPVNYVESKTILKSSLVYYNPAVAEPVKPEQTAI